MLEFEGLSQLIEKIRIARENCCAQECEQRCPNVIITNVTDVQPNHEVDHVGGDGSGGQEGEQEVTHLLNDVIRVATCGKCCANDEKHRAPSCIIADVPEIHQIPEVDRDGVEEQEGGHDKVDLPRNSQGGQELDSQKESNSARVSTTVNQDASNPDSQQINDTDSTKAGKDDEVSPEGKDSAEQMPKDGTFSHERSFEDTTGMDRGSVKHLPDPPLVLAVKHANLDDIKKTLRESPDSINEPDRYKQTPIFWAVRHGNMNVMQVLIKAKAKVEGVANKYGYTPLMRAIHYGQMEVSEKLLNLRADLAALDKFNGTILQVAATAGQVEAVEWLMSKSQVYPLIIHADDDGRTPLHVATKNGHHAVVEMLLEASAHPNTRDRHGRAPLLFSLARYDVLSIDSLISHKAEIDFRNPHGQPLLHVLIDHMCNNKHRNDTLCGIVTLFEAQVNVNEKDRNLLTPLVIAVRGNHPMICTLLCAYDADIRNLSGIARACAFFEIASILEEFVWLRQNTNAKSDGVKAVRTCLQEVKALLSLNIELSVAISEQNSEFAVVKLQELFDINLNIHLDKFPVTMFLQEFLDILRKLVIDNSLKNLREVRLRERERQFLEFRKDLRIWHDKNELDPKGLQSVVGDGVSSILMCKLSSLELDDPYTKSVEDVQTALYNEILQKFTNMYSVVFEEQSALGSFPDPDLQIIIKKLQCPKCLEFSVSPAALVDHSKYCTSRKRENMQKDHRNQQARKADTAIHRLENAVKTYHARIQTFEDLLEETLATKQACRKKTPGAMIPLRACASLLEMVIVLLKRRLIKCDKIADDAVEKWFPNGNRDASASVGTSCVICLVEKATTIGVHMEKIASHHVACTPCAVILQTKLKRGEQVLCPVPLCKKPLKRLQKESDDD